MKISPNKTFLGGKGSFGCQVVSLKQLLVYDCSKTCAQMLSAHVGQDSRAHPCSWLDAIRCEPKPDGLQT